MGIPCLVRGIFPSKSHKENIILIMVKLYHRVNCRYANIDGFVNVMLTFDQFKAIVDTIYYGGNQELEKLEIIGIDICSRCYYSQQLGKDD